MRRQQGEADGPRGFHQSLTGTAPELPRKGNRRPLTRQGALHSQSHGQDHHEGLVGHWVNDSAHNGTLVPFPRYPAIKEVGDACVGKKAQGPSVMVMKDAVTNERGGNEAGCGQDIGDGVDVLMSRDRECLL